MTACRDKAGMSGTLPSPGGATPSRRRRRAWLGLLLLASILGLLQFFRSSWYREQRLRRMTEPELRAWTAEQPNEALGHFHLGLLRGRAGDTREAARQLARALELDPTLSRARWRLARVLAATGQESSAERLLQRGLQLDPRAARLHLELGRIYEERQEFGLAAREWEKVTSLSARDDEAWFHLGQCRMRMNDEVRALPPYRRAVDLEPGSVTYRKALASALRVNRQYAAAERHARRALELDASDPDTHFVLAKLFWDRDGATPQTEQSMRRAAALQPENPLVRYAMANIYQQRGKLEAAAREYEATLHLLERGKPAPTSAVWSDWEGWYMQVEGPHFNLGKLLQRLGRTAEAAPHLAMFRRISDYRNRAHQLRVRIDNRPGDASLHFELARLHTAAGVVQLAKEEYRAGLTLRSDSRAQAELRALLRGRTTTGARRPTTNAR